MREFFHFQFELQQLDHNFLIKEVLLPIELETSFYSYF